MSNPLLPSSASRRDFLKASAFAGVSLLGSGIVMAEPSENNWLGDSEAFVPCRAITSGPKHHWFGYYDKQQFSADNRFVLSNEVGFEHRTPKPEDTIGVGMVDLESKDEWVPLGTSNAWGWQQGCMLQWRPGHENEVIWNDRQDGRFVCHIKHVETGDTRTLGRPVYALSPDGKWGVTADFARIQNMRPGYGYQGVADPVADVKAPESSGIWRVDLETGEDELIVPLSEVAAMPYRGQNLADKWHYFNHLLVNTDGTRFIFLHRWRDTPTGTGRGGFTTRMFTANPDGSDLHVLDPSGYTSHFIWKNPTQVCAWTRPAGKPSAFYLFTDRTDELEVVGQGIMKLNGHNTYLPIDDAEWILNDTYPDRKTRRQTPYLYHTPTRERTDLGHFYLPPKYSGEWRCDTHPRSSNDGRLVTIDSPHGGNGRQVWLLDVSSIVS